jgi:1,4-alpha-glucan branching enzyme
MEPSPQWKSASGGANLCARREECVELFFTDSIFPDDMITRRRSALSVNARAMTKPVNFYCAAPGAKTVCLVGDFNGWSPSSNPMQRQVDGSWFLQMPLPHGHHRYYFLVDGAAALDPRASGKVRSEWNGEVSVVAVS